MFFKEEKPPLKLNLRPYEQKSEDNKDRRYLPRWEINNKVFYRKSDDTVHEAFSKDISATGVCLCSDEFIAVDENLNLTIYLAQNHEPLLVRGKAIWRTSKEKESFIGIQFDNTGGDRTNERIFNYAFEYKRDQLMKRWFQGS